MNPKYIAELKSKSTIIIIILITVFIAIAVLKLVDGQTFSWELDPNGIPSLSEVALSSNSYLSHTNNNRTYFYRSDDRTYFHFRYEGEFCVDQNNKIQDMANCKLEDRIEKNMLLSDEVPLLRDGKDNDTIIYDLPRLEEKGYRSDDVFPELPFPTPPAPPLKKQQEKRQI